MAFLKEEEEHHQGAGPRGSSSRPSTRHEAAAAPRDYPAAGEDEDDIQSDLVPSANTFIRKLYQMVTNENNDIIAFTPDGLSFHVKDPARLESEILPKYFRHSRFQSLVRQLNFYDFKKISKERVIWIYRHKLFQHHKPHLLDELKRKPSASLVKSRTGSATTRRTITSTTTSRSRSSTSGNDSSSDHDDNSQVVLGSNGRVASAAGGAGRRNGGRGQSQSPDSGNLSSPPSSSTTSPSTSPGRQDGPKKRRRNFHQQEQQHKEVEEEEEEKEEDDLYSSFTSVSASSSYASLSSSSSSSLSSSSSTHRIPRQQVRGTGGVTGAGGLSCREALTDATTAFEGHKWKKQQQQRQRGDDEEDEEEGEGEEEEREGEYCYREDAMEFSYWQAPSHEEEGEVNEQEEEEACWAIKKMMMGGTGEEKQQQQQVVEGGFDEGVQELPEDDEMVVVMPAGEEYRSFENVPTATDYKPAPPSLPPFSSVSCVSSHGQSTQLHQQHQSMMGHQEEKTGSATFESSYSSQGRSSSRTGTHTPLPCTSFSPYPSSFTPAAFSAYVPTPEEHLAWAKIQSYWNSAGPSLQQALILSLPSQLHQAWTSFFLVIPPFQSQEGMIHACHSLLSTSPALAASVHEHRLALDPLAAASPDKTFFLQAQQQHQKEKEAGHNGRALREVLGFGLNHLMEAARSLSPLDVSQAAMALRECLQAWKGHTGRLL
ncbi:hypothetical protein VYU27_004081 [Nannochloropsis oceanica]